MGSNISWIPSWLSIAALIFCSVSWNNSRDFPRIESNEHESAGGNPGMSK